MSEQPSGRPTELTGCFTLANGVVEDQDEARVSVPQSAGCECLHKIGGRLSSRVIAVQKGGHRRCGAHADWRSERQGRQEGKRRQGWQRPNRQRHHAGRKREDAKKSSEKNKNKTRFYCKRQGYSKSDCSDISAQYLRSSVELLYRPFWKDARSGVYWSESVHLQENIRLC